MKNLQDLTLEQLNLELSKMSKEELDNAARAVSLTPRQKPVYLVQMLTNSVQTPSVNQAIELARTASFDSGVPVKIHLVGASGDYGVVFTAIDGIVRNLDNQIVFK